MPCNAETCGEDEDEEGVKEEESPAFNMMVLPSAELGRLWLVILLLLFTFESLLDDILLKERTDLRGRLQGDLSASSSAGEKSGQLQKSDLRHCIAFRWAPSGWATFKESGMTSEVYEKETNDMCKFGRGWCEQKS